MTAAEAAELRAWLKARADSYGRDAGILRRDGDTDNALVYEAIRDELRDVTALLAGDS